MGEEFITTTQLCEWLKISNATASRWRVDGMPYYGKGRSLRYLKSEVRAWLEQEQEKERARRQK